MTKAEASSPTAPRKRRPRRSKDEIMANLLAAAIEEFEQNGYEKARTAAIAQRADVVEPLLFKYFGSKFNLFQQAIFQTLDGHFRQFTETHAVRHDDLESRALNARAYIGEQKDFLEKASRMFMSLVVNESYETFAREGMGAIDGLQLYLDKMADTAEGFLSASGGIDPKLTARLSFGTLLAVSLFRKWLFPAGLADAAAIRAATVSYIMKGADILPPGAVLPPEG